MDNTDDVQEGLIAQIDRREEGQTILFHTDVQLL